jgi:hypothetical protein
MYAMPIAIGGSYPISNVAYSGLKKIKHLRKNIYSGIDALTIGQQRKYIIN